MPGDDRNSAAQNTPDTRSLLLQAAQRCVERDGISKLNIKRVAEEANVTRQTVYRYFATTEELLTAASFAVGGNVLGQMQTRLAKCTSFSQKIVQSVMFLVEAVPGDPFLSQYFSPTSPPELTARLVFGDAPLEYSYRAVRSMYGKEKISAAEARWLRGLAEHALRLVLALILAPSRKTTSSKGLKDYLDTWLAPLLDQS